jgi:two-component system sensor histidine kinase/response regulator
MDSEISSTSHRLFFNTSPFNSADQLAMTAVFGPVIFDKQHALARLGGLEDVLRDVMQLMTTESPRVYAEIGASFQRGDVVALKRSAHTLKGAVGLVGAIDLVRRLRHVEDSASSGELATAAKEFDEIDRQFAELQRILALELLCN